MGRRLRAGSARAVIAAGIVLTGGAVLPARCLVAPARAADDAVVLEHLSFREGSITVEMPRVEAHGTPLSADGLREILDPSSALDLAQRLTRLTATTLAVPNLTLRRDAEAGGASPQEVTFHDVLLTDVQAGKAAGLMIRAVDGRLGTEDAASDTVSVGTIAAHAIDPQLMLQIATGSRNDKDFPVSPVLHDLAIDSLKLGSDKAQAFEVGHIETGPLSGRPFLDTPVHLLRRLENRQGAVKPDMSDPLYQTLVDAALSLRMERFEVSRTGFSAPDGTGFRLARVVLAAAGPAGLPSIAVDGAALDAAGVHLSMRTAVLSGDGTGAVFTRAAALLAGQQSAAAVPVASDATGAVDFEIADIRLVLPPTSGGPFPPGTVNTIDVPSFVFGESASAGGGKVEVHQRVKVRYDMPAVGSDPTLQMMGELGLSHLDATFGYRASYDAAEHAIRLDELTLGGKGIGRITASGKVGDLPDAPFRPDTTSDGAAERFAGATVRDASITLVDEGFMARALPVLARQSGTSSTMLKAALKTKVDLALPGLLGQTPAAVAVGRAIDGFIDAGGTLTLSARSDKGVSVDTLSDVQDPTALLSLFDISAIGMK